MRTLIVVSACLLGAPALAAPPRPRPKPAPVAPAPEPPPPVEDKRKAQAQAVATQAVEAYKERRFSDAADLFDRANASFPAETLVWNAGQAWEKTGELKLAKDRYSEFLSFPDVDPLLRVQAGEALVRVGKKLAAREAAATPRARLDLLKRELKEANEAQNVELARKLDGAILIERRAIAAEDAARPSDVGEWVLIGTGGALVVGGIVTLLVGQSTLDGVAEAQDGGGLVTAMTRTQAESDLESGETLRIVGAVVGGVGVAAAVTGAILLASDDPAPVRTDGRVHVGVAPTSGGAFLTTTFGF